MPDFDVFTDDFATDFTVFNKIEHFVILNRQRFRNAALFPPCEKGSQIIIMFKWPMHIKVMSGSFRKAPVIIVHKLISILIGCVNRRNSPEPEFFYQSVLERQMSAFHAAFGRAGIGTDSLDIQFMHRTPKLGIAIATSGIFVVYSEYTGFVAV
ncbi:hypothetical protein YA24_12815 [Klebsiella aerogenes]|nr:hypothetical protein YA24_12815 [Klebsiella aerogenes]